MWKDEHGSCWWNRCPKCWSVLSVRMGDKYGCSKHGWFPVEETIFACPLNLSLRGTTSGSESITTERRGGFLSSLSRAAGW